MEKLIGAVAIIVLSVFAYFGAKSLGLFGNPDRQAVEIQLALMDQAKHLEAEGHLPWDSTDIVASTRVVGMKLSVQITHIAPSQGMVQATVCNYRRMRLLIQSGATIELIWKPEPNGAVMAVSTVNKC
jgi:hypothetical protein